MAPAAAIGSKQPNLLLLVLGPDLLLPHIAPLTPCSPRR